jgi:hypothetical protein
MKIFRRLIFKCECGHITQVAVGNRIWFQLPTTCECGKPFVAWRGVWVRWDAVIRFFRIHNAEASGREANRPFAEPDGCKDSEVPS